jgi:hypothetical protein
MTWTSMPPLLVVVVVVVVEWGVPNNIVDTPELADDKGEILWSTPLNVVLLFVVEGVGDIFPLLVIEVVVVVVVVVVFPLGVVIEPIFPPMLV